MTTDHVHPNFCRVAMLFNAMLSSTDKNIAQYCQAVSALAAGDLIIVIRGEHRGAFKRLQKNFNLAMATMRAVLGRQGIYLFAETAGKFSGAIARFRARRVLYRTSGVEEFKPVISPARVLRLRLARALGIEIPTSQIDTNPTAPNSLLTPLPCRVPGSSAGCPIGLNDIGANLRDAVV
ncbi:chemotaxis protein (plasmid) [Rhizobium sp. CB3090]|uniref:chemotaxis protein n=1 Tax=Rhizobium sp. CB3090 TaxID=3039156 RepID=UPI0024B1B4EE|nr:chemotaxis protein [Rhizobium sp. CB3090]WFU12914.1 chemotaxis protein [Rhizobium sp. CB3090]